MKVPMFLGLKSELGLKRAEDPWEKGWKSPKGYKMNPVLQAQGTKIPLPCLLKHSQACCDYPYVS